MFVLLVNADVVDNENHGYTVFGLKNAYDRRAVDNFMFADATFHRKRTRGGIRKKIRPDEWPA